MTFLDSLQHARALRRSTVMTIDAVATAPYQLSSLWAAVVAGDLLIVDMFFSPERCYCVMVPRFRRRPLSERHLEILRRVLLSTPAKVVAMDLGISQSGVAGVLKHCYRALLDGAVPHGSPLLLAMAARAALGDRVEPARLSRLELESATAEIVSVARPDAALAERLTPAEHHVVSLMVEGYDHEQIAKLRGISARTVANQLGSAYRRLRISGRGQLLDYLLAVGPGRTGPGISHERCSARGLLCRAALPQGGSRCFSARSALHLNLLAPLLRASAEATGPVLTS